MACPGRCQGFGSHVSRPWGCPSRKSGPAASAVPPGALRLGPTCSERRSRLVVGDAGVGRQARVHTPSATSQPRARSLYLCASASPPVAGDGSTLWRRGRLKVHVQSLAHREWVSPWLVRPALRAGVLGSTGGGREHSLTHPPSSSLPGRGSWDPGAGSRCPRPRPPRWVLCSAAGKPCTWTGVSSERLALPAAGSQLLRAGWPLLKIKTVQRGTAPEDSRLHLASVARASA